MVNVFVRAMRWISGWPLHRVRALGAGFGLLLWWFAARRRHIARVNLRLCFPDWSAAERNKLAKQHFTAFGQSVLDRAWLWHAPESVVRERLQWSGQVEALSAPGPLIMLAPHFVGLDAGGLAVGYRFAPAPVAFIFKPQSHSEVERWVRAGRERTGNARLYFRHEGIRKILSGIKHGEPLHLSPDMDFGAKDSVFVPFMGVPAATLMSLHRMARMTGARVVPVITRLTDQGYSIEVLAPLVNFPSEDMAEDTARMNQVIEQQLRRMPEQYHWVHRRFKTRPPGEASVY